MSSRSTLARRNESSVLLTQPSPRQSQQACRATQAVAPKGPNLRSACDALAFAQSHRTHRRAIQSCLSSLLLE
jgi:hypothetical protein